MPHIDALLEQVAQARREHRHKDAERLASQALTLSERSGSRIDLARAVIALGQVARDEGRPDEALQLYEQAADIYRTDGPVLRYAHTIRHVADILLDLSQPETAEAVYDEALELYRGDPETNTLDFANALRGAALAKAALGKRDEARSLFGQVRDLYAKLGIDAGVAESDRVLARLAAAQGS
jgi:tetratricopeptide (TPR) repeat protein